MFGKRRTKTHVPASCRRFVYGPWWSWKRWFRVENDMWVTSNLPRTIPYPLAKAICDEFEYVMCLKDGTLIRFTGAEFDGDLYVALGDATIDMDLGPVNPSYPDRRPFQRGVSVRLDHIAWVADAPWGS